MHRAAYRSHISLRDLERECRTGDILLFSGDGVFSRFEEFFNWSEFGHVAIVYRHKRWGVCVWESSTRDATQDLLTGGSDKDGPRLIKLRDKLRIYVDKWGSKVVWRRLHVRKGALRRDWQKRVAALIRRVHKRPFEQHPEDMARSLVTWLPGGQPGGDLTSLFCSETVALTYVKMGLFPPTRPPDQYTVIDFAEGEDRDLPWRRDRTGRRLAWLGSEVEVDV